MIMEDVRAIDVPDVDMYVAITTGVGIGLAILGIVAACGC
jgi:hypothetical protein